MKRLLLILILLPALVFSQENDDLYADRVTSKQASTQPSPEPFRKANTILVYTQQPAEEIWKSLGRGLSQGGYAIASSSSDFLTISTAPKDAGKWNADYIASFAVDNAGVIKVRMKTRIKSNFLVGTDATDYDDWEYTHTLGSINGTAYTEVMKVLRSLGNYKIAYLKE